MPLSEKAEEILEGLWVEQVEGGREQNTLETILGADSCHRQAEPPAGTIKENSEVRELLAAGLVQAPEERWLSLTEAGKTAGKEIVRNHRLAERLLADVLDMPGDPDSEEAACRFEHVLKRGLDERICTLLGHPSFCPHGLPIPPGPCCLEKRSTSARLVAPLSELKEGESGTIAYIHTKERERLERLMALGVLPGQGITLLQRFPSFVFRVGETQVAMDNDLAGHIYVRPGGKRAEVGLGRRRRRRFFRSRN
jgi:DtxR family transcriptional regulator, Mn-dependent transcriptional regulator